MTKLNNVRLGGKQPKPNKKQAGKRKAKEVMDGIVVLEDNIYKIIEVQK